MRGSGHAGSNVTHGVAELSADPIRLVAERPGSYDIAWEVHGTELAAPAKGTFTVEVRPQPRSGEPVTSLDRLLGTGEVHVAKDSDSEG